MTKQTINVGTVVNDGSGDDIRSAFLKVNNNFNDLYARNGEQNTASNSGSGIGIYKQKVGVNLQFKSIIAGSGLSVTADSDALTISNTDHAKTNVLSDILNNIDFGGISTMSGTNVIEFLLQNIEIDCGTITSPSSMNFDCGSIV